ncbi:hypothetical protein, partial [Thioalkalivibrio sp. ALE23]|uniref:hypothetical protein n=1 Tax=Thioalkalivibrio sp. ALE23 TaxID=1265495 RepID=UPI0005713036
MQGIKHGKQTPIAVGVMIALGMGVTGAQADFTDRESVEDLRGHMEERMNVEIQPGPESTRDTSERRQSGSTSNIGGADSTGTVVGGNPGGVGQTASEKCEDLGFEWDGGACVIDGEENVI